MCCNRVSEYHVGTHFEQTLCQLINPPSLFFVCFSMYSATCNGVMIWRLALCEGNPIKTGQSFEILMFYSLYAWTRCWLNNRIAGDFRTRIKFFGHFAPGTHYQRRSNVCQAYLGWPIIQLHLDSASLDPLIYKSTVTGNMKYEVLLCARRNLCMICD